MKIKYLLLAGLLMFSSNLYALDVVSVDSVYTTVDKTNQEITEALSYMNELAYGYSRKVVVKKTYDYKLEPIDAILESITSEVTIDEIDNAQIEFDISKNIGDKAYRQHLFNMRNLAYFGGLQMNFEPIVAYDMYRDFQIIAGYISYYGSETDVDKVLNNYINGVQNVTKEIISTQMKNVLRKNIESTLNYMKNDKKLKIFIVKEDKVDSMFER